MKTLLVVGSAPCLHEDVRRAQQLRPFAALMLVNGSCTAIESSEFVLAGHTEKSEMFAAARRAAFPNAPRWELFATRSKDRSGPNSEKDWHELEYPSVTKWFPEEMGVGATSASKGIKIGFKFLGFDEAILCGSPMDDSGYVDSEAQVIQSPNCIRIGKKYPDNRDPKYTQYVHARAIQQRYRDRFKELAEGEFKGCVFSMSGFTRDCLGEPRIL